MSAQHTPGPWQNQEMPSGAESAHGSRVVSFITYGPDNVADVCDSRGLSEQEARANARLIAAAPELLEALMLCRFDSLNMSLADLEFCRAAIAKATGAQP